MENAPMRCFFISTMLTVFFTAGHAQQPRADTAEIFQTFTKIPLTAEFKGGEVAWQRFLIKNLHAGPGLADNDFNGMVTVQFVVSPTGRVSQVEVTSKADSAWAREIIRVVKRSDGMWTPAMACGRLVSSYKKLPICVRLEQ